MKKDYVVIAPDISHDDKMLEYVIKKAMLLSLAERGTITVNQYKRCLELIKNEEETENDYITKKDF